MKNMIGEYMQESSNIFAENRILRVCVVGMLIMTVLNSISIGNLKDSIVTHIVPVGTSQNFILTGSTANDEYLRSMARYVTHMIGNMTPATARQQFTELLTLWHSTTYSEYRDRFDEIADSIERYPSVSYHSIWDGKGSISLKGETMRISVIKQKIVGDTVTKKIPIDIEIGYVIENGQFFIISVKEVGGESV